MRILFLSHYFPPEGNAPASRVCAMAKRWIASGHEVQVITCAPNVPNGVVYEGYRNRLRQTECLDGIQVTRVWTYLAPNRGKCRRGLNFLTYLVSAFLTGLLVKRPDVVIATSPQFFCGWAGALLANVRRLPFVLDIRDIWPASIVAVGAMEENTLVRVLRFLERRMYARADHIVAVGECYKEDLLERGVPEEKISVIMNGVDTDLFTPQEPDIRLKHGLGIDGEFVCAYVGTVGMACGLQVVLRAARKLQEMGCLDIRFLIVGDGAIRAELQGQAEALGLENVIFTGLQPREMMPNFLSIADVCLVHLRRSKLFKRVMPSKIFEAAGMARPIILGLEGFAADFLLHANAGVTIEPENAEALVNAVLDLSNDRQRCRTYGESGHEYVMARYDRDELADAYIEVIEDVLGVRSPSVLADRLSRAPLSTQE